MENVEITNFKNAKLKKHPKKKCNFLGHIFFCWQLPIIIQNWKHKSSQDNFYRPLHGYDSKQLGDKLEELWQNEVIFAKNPSLTRVLLKLFGCNFFCFGILLIPTELSFLFLQNFSLQKLLDFFTPYQTTINSHQAYFYATLMTVVLLCRTIVFYWTLMELGVLGIKLRVACSSLIYRKTLKLKQSDLNKVTKGHLLNLLSNNVNKFDNSLILMHWLWIAPLNLVLGSFYMYFKFGLVALAGVPAIMVWIILQMSITKKFSSAKAQATKKTDYRIQLMNDIICSMRTVKIYTWEKPFQDLVDAARKSEIKKISTANKAALIQFIINIITPSICMFCSVIVAIMFNRNLTSQYYYCLEHIYEIFALYAVYLFEGCIGSLVEIKISIKRIQEYLLFEQQTSSCDENKYCVLKSHKIFQHRYPGISINNATLTWNQSSNVVLTDVNFDASSQEIVGVTGATGSGKSTLLYSILQEVEVLKGKVDVKGTVSYACQEPWIFSASIKQNVLFGEDFDLEKYTKVIKICGLEHDLRLFAHGDQTLVGEKGVMLSGGQEARINLARAVYRDADIYLFDDPLSAVDVYVAEQIFNECIRGYLKDKCVVLVHQGQFVQNIDNVYMVDSGRVIHTQNGASENLKCITELKTDKLVDNLVLSNRNKLQSEMREDQGVDKIKLNVYQGYLEAIENYSLTCLTAVFLFTSQVIYRTIDYFMSIWINLEHGTINFDSNVSYLTTYHCIYIYATLMVLVVITLLVTCFLFCRCCYQISKNLHSNMLLKIFHSTITFLDHHSSGRILSRFTSDMGIIDEIIPCSIIIAIIYFLMIVGIVVLIIQSNYWMAIPTVILVALIAFCSMVFQFANRHWKRAEAITRSVLFSHLTASIQSLPTIRAFGAQRKIIEEFDSHQNFHSTALYLCTSLLCAFEFWISVICVLFASLVMFSFFFLDSVPSVGDVGLAISLSLALIDLVNSTLTKWGQLEGYMVSVERLLEYADLESERDDCTINHIPENWPTNGNLKFTCVSLQYLPETPFVLKNVNFIIKSGEKVGIIGRTGAGKSSLLSVLFRLFPFEGTVEIDDINTKTIPLNILRSKISIIPQEPSLFLGPLRKNIDPFNEYSDEKIWKCLEETGLTEMVSKLDGGLDTVVSEGGSNFSVGERQLLCMVRVMLRDNKIIVLDEATANVDLKADELIQSSIRTKFSDCTVLTIAHRLKTVIDYDKILVMADGEVVEFGKPSELLQNSTSFLYQYVNKNRMESLNS